MTSDVLALAGPLVTAGVNFLLPTVSLLTVAGLIASVAQSPPRIVPDRILPDASRISLRKGLSRVFGARGWTEFLKSLIKLAAVIAVAVMMLIGQRVVLLTAMDVDPGLLPQRVLDLSVKSIAAVLVATVVVAAADLGWSRILWRRDHRMSKQEVKEELRQAEGDRMVKARLRSLRLDRSRRRMLSAVPRATMVVVNPTHYAVALRYVRAEGGAPMVLAKGADFIALKIRSIAEDHGYSDSRGQAPRTLALCRRRRRSANSGRILSSRRRDRPPDSTKEGSMGPTKIMSGSGRGLRPRRPPEREQIIADALVGFASELRLTDAAELMSMIQNDQAANLADLVNSSTELYFKSGTMRYALSASFKAPWDATPTVEIDLEFRHAAVCAFFRLTIGQRRAGVEILDILFEDQGLDDFAKAERLSEALDAARL